MKKLQAYLGPIAAGTAFLAAFGFFQFFYPYHLMRREQQTLFLFDWDYICQTYRGSGWLVRFVCDFVDQFFHLPVVGPVVIALALVGIGAAAYKICRHFMGKWPSLVVGALFFLWSFFRETENLYSTRYTLVMLGYLGLVLAAFQFRKAWAKAGAAAVLLAFGAWALGTPMHQYYGKLWGMPVLSYDKVIGLDTECDRENWDKVIRQSKKDLHITEASYCYNLAFAKKGMLSHELLNHSENYTNSLLLWIHTDKSVFSNCLAGEAWFQLGDMTLAEQSAIIALQASPKHSGARYVRRMARVNLISREYGAAQKYLGLLSKTLFYGKWARHWLAAIEDGSADEKLGVTRTKLAHSDFVYSTNISLRNVLLGLLEANPDNVMAREYLLCYDLLGGDLDYFIEDYAPDKPNAPLYQEAILIWLTQNDRPLEEEAPQWGVSQTTLDRLNRFFQRPEKYKNTYWYYYTDKASYE